MCKYDRWFTLCKYPFVCVFYTNTKIHHFFYPSFSGVSCHRVSQVWTTSHCFHFPQHHCLLYIFGYFHYNVMSRNISLSLLLTGKNFLVLWRCSQLHSDSNVDGYFWYTVSFSFPAHVKHKWVFLLPFDSHFMFFLIELMWAVAVTMHQTAAEQVYRCVKRSCHHPLVHLVFDAADRVHSSWFDSSFVHILLIFLFSFLVMCHLCINVPLNTGENGSYDVPV